MVDDEKLAVQAKNNSIDNFKFGFYDAYLEKWIGRMEQNQDIFSKIMDNKEFGDLVKDYMLKEVYKKLNKM